ncbi:MAG: hypothetical protein GYA45_11635 [Pelolinea sp.]|nr:hypothetical protein [Pelolinea sp.]
MVNALYYDPVFFDASWGLHHLVRMVRNVIARLILRIVGASYSGRTQLARHFTKVIDITITPKAIAVEAIWTGYRSGASQTVTINIPAVANPYVVVCSVMETTASASFSATLNGAAMTELTGALANRAVKIFGLIPGTTGPQDVVVTSGDVKTHRVSVYLLSGVNQTTPTLDAKTATSNGATSLTTPSMSASQLGLIVDCASFVSGTVSSSSGQTETTVNSIKHSGTLIPPATSTTTTWGTTSSSAGRICAVSLNPA